MKRTSILIVAVVLAACAQPAPATPSPLASPTAPASATASPASPSRATAATMRIEGTVRKWCGSIGGCAYFATVKGPERGWQAEFTLDRAGTLAIGRGLPATPPAGVYTLTLSSRAVSDAILNGVRQLGPTDASCSVELTIVPGQHSVGARGSFYAHTCTVEATQ